MYCRAHRAGQKGTHSVPPRLDLCSVFLMLFAKQAYQNEYG